MEDKRDDARSGLTPREAEMLRWISQGKSKVEIGVTPGINALTVKDHVRKAVARAVALRILAPHEIADHSSSTRPSTMPD